MRDQKRSADLAKRKVSWNIKSLLCTVWSKMALTILQLYSHLENTGYRGNQNTEISVRKYFFPLGHIVS